MQHAPHEWSGARFQFRSTAQPAIEDHIDADVSSHARRQDDAGEFLQPARIPNGTNVLDRSRFLSGRAYTAHNWFDRKRGGELVPEAVARRDSAFGNSI